MSKTNSSTKTKTVFIDKNKVISEIRIPNSLNVDRVDFNKIKSFKINKGEVFERECDYDWNDKTISVYASNNGKAGMENQYDFPPPIDSQLYFGNVLVICHTNNKVENLTMSDYNQFYEDAMGGFESLGESDSYSDEEEPDSDDSINDFIVNDDEDVEVENSSDSEEECGSSSESDDSEAEPELQSTGESGNLKESDSDSDSDFNEESGHCDGDDEDINVEESGRGQEGGDGEEDGDEEDKGKKKDT
tara:strand:- start:383 stop:1123 length:741 start_codon:yes stop_codon:yes gene_type:complete